MIVEPAEAAQPDIVEEQNPLSMSDADIMNMSAPGVTKVVIEAEPEPVIVAAPEPAAEAVVTPEPAAVVPAPVDPTGSSEAVADPDAVVADVPVEPASPDYEGFFKKVMTPFKANGKMIELKDPEEAVALMQRGANYTRKMQDLVPHRKQLTMLQNNNIDEERLSFLIDLDKKDPEAIKKLIKESGIDPLEIDTATEPAYQGGNHRVTDEEVNFGTSLEELGSTPEGKETLQLINSQWDQASKDVLWKNPEIMTLIHGQREYGIYDRIVAEMDRQRTLGTLSATTSFLSAYKTVGDQLTAADAFADLREKDSGNAPAKPPTPPVPVETKAVPIAVATRVVAPKPTVKDDPAANAASPTRAAPTPAEVFVNPLSLSDDEFLKKFSGRL